MPESDGETGKIHYSNVSKHCELREVCLLCESEHLESLRGERELTTRFPERCILMSSAEDQGFYNSYKLFQTSTSTFADLLCTLETIRL